MFPQSVCAPGQSVVVCRRSRLATTDEHDSSRSPRREQSKQPVHGSQSVIETPLAQGARVPFSRVNPD